MPPTDLSEQGLELAIVANLTGLSAAQVKASTTGSGIAETPAAYDAEWNLGNASDYDRVHVVDPVQLMTFLETTQPEVVAALNLGQPGMSRTRFLERLQSEVTKRGVIDVLRKGIKHQSESVELYYGAPTEGNLTAAQRFRANRFSITRQLRYSQDETRRALDLALFVNGLPIATLELKNQITNRTVTDAIEQYRTDRSPKEKLFQLGVCAVHFAVDDNEVWFTTRLEGKATRFLPFNKGFKDGAGNPPNPDGIKTDYLWKDVLRRDSLAELIEQFITTKTTKTKKMTEIIFPRYHQRDVVRRLLADARANGVGRRYLIQHSAGSGKSNSIAWLAWQLIEQTEHGKPLFDTVIIVTDRRALDSQLTGTVKAMGQSASFISHAESSSELGTEIRKGQRIITTTVQKFPFIADTIGSEHRDRTFAIIIDEAHSSQGGRATSKLNATLAKDLGIDPDADEELSFEDHILIAMRERKMLENASYFAFTATPKNRTLEMFGERYDTPDGEVRFRPFHTYTMKQAIDEGFILDVLQNYTPYQSYYRLMKKVGLDDDPEFDRKRAQRKLRKYVEEHPSTVRKKAEIIVEHFHTQVLRKQKVDGKARAMVVTASIRRAIDYWQAIEAVLAERKSPVRAIVAFSGEQDVDGRTVTEATLNGFPSSKIPDMFKDDPYRLLIVADKFQTGFDEPLLHTMYVDKALSSVKAVQTLSRLNRAHPAKSDTFVLDFFNDADDIERAFQPFYRTTVLSGESDPNKLHDLQAQLDEAGVYREEQVTAFVDGYLTGADIATLHPLLDAARIAYEQDLDEEQQIAFKGAAKAFVRTYGFLSAILPYANAEWEERAIFLRFLVPKLPAPDDPDLAKGILEAIDLETYRVEARATMTIALADEEGEIAPPPTGEGAFQKEIELDRLSVILQTFNDLFADHGFDDTARAHAMGAIRGPIMDAIQDDRSLEDTRASGDEQNTIIQFRDTLEKALTANMGSVLQVYKKQQDDPAFRQHFEDLVYDLYRTRAQGQPSAG